MIPGSMSVDAAKADREAMPIEDLEEILDDMKNGPGWRTRADVECNYYDGNQHTPEDLQRAEERNLPVVTVNLVAPTIDLILGMEARTRTDWVVKSDHSVGSLTAKQADGLSAKLNEAERNTYADTACADAYESMVKAGIGWVEVARNTDPFRYKFRVSAVDRREIWWDMRAKDTKLLSDARFLVRKKWNDLDAVLKMVPDEFARYVKGAMNNPAGWDMAAMTNSLPYMQDNMIGRDHWFRDSSEWWDSERRRVCAYEVWYRVWKKGLVLRLQNDQVVEYDKKNPIHVATVASGQGELQWAAYQKMRLAWWVGPYRILDIPSPYGHNEFPYIPFIAKLEDDTKTPYGLIRAMKSLQDEVNARRAKMMWLLSSQRVIAEGDAVDDHNAAAAEVNRPDAYIKLSKGRKQRGSQDPFRIEDNQGMSAQQYNVYEDAKRSLQQAAGVYAPMLGDSSSGADAGVAIDMLIEQGTTTLAKVNSNYKLSRTEVGRKLLHMVISDMAGKETRVTLPDTAPSGARSVTFNKRAVKPNTGESFIENDVTAMMWRVALADVPNNPTHNSQRMKDLVEFAKSLPPDLQVLFADVVMAASDIPNKDQIAARIRQKLGLTPMIDPEDATQEEIAEAQAQMAASQKQQAVQELATKIELEQGAAKAQKDAAAAAKTMADTEQSRAKTGLVRAQAIEILLGANLQAPEAPSEPGEGASAAPAQPKAAPPDDQEIAEAASKTLSLENPVHGDRISMGPGM